MYLQELAILNSGPVECLTLTPEFRDDGSPKPIVLVGANGSGKTTALSMITDALVELATSYFTDAAPTLGVGHRFYRMLGAETTRQGANFELAAVRFSDQPEERRVVSKAGAADAAVLATYIQRFPEINKIASGAASKVISQPQTDLDQTFRNGTYVFFPASRAELPSWSTEPKEDQAGPFVTPISNELRKPIIVERALSLLKPWLIDLILDASMDTMTVLESDDLTVLKQQASQVVAPIISLQNVNSIIATVLGEQEAHIIRTGRFSGARKLMIARNGMPIIPTLEALSAGQASLFSIFATITRYGDQGRLIRPNKQIEGIVCIDEADSHLHPSLQYRALPDLIALFPRVQFLISSHSPLFPLGMKNRFGEDGFTLLHMPEGRRIPVERYDDFLSAFEFFERTATFERRIEELGRAGGRPIVLCEGETDPSYLATAARVLGFKRLTQGSDFDWVGTNVAGAAQGGGKNNLNDAWKFLSSNPGLVNRRIVLLYDADARKPDRDQDTVHVRSMPHNATNSRATGVENLLPVQVLEERFYRTETSLSGTTEITRRILDKTVLCGHVCQASNVQSFQGFRSMLDMLDALIFGPSPPGTLAPAGL